MSPDLSILLAQINPVVGDLPYNSGRIEEIWQNASSTTDLIVFPELVLCGYTPEDLILKPSFLNAVNEQLQKLCAASLNYPPAILIGTPWFHEGKIYNAAHLIANGEIVATICKHHLPNYDVFDEARIFSAGPLPKSIFFKGHTLGILICEDMWYRDVAVHLGETGAEILICINASPYDAGKIGRRLNAARDCVNATKTPLLYINQVGGQDETVYDGGSFVLNSNGAPVAQISQFSEQTLSIQWQKEKKLLSPNKKIPPILLDKLTADYMALMIGLRDYVTKNGFKGVLIGLSGGIDSALTAALAVDALGPESVQGVLLPSRYTSQESLTDAATLGKELNIELQTFSIAAVVNAFEKTLDPFLTDYTNSAILDLVHQNIQPRARGSILMALSNASGRMLLTTGNKSEIAVGYATLYGDMCGGFNPLKDVYKTHVYALSHWRNAYQPPGGRGPAGAVIPQNSLTRPPTAELKPGQIDQDTLPPYDILDGILEGLLEKNLGAKDLVALGYVGSTVTQVARMLDLAEYKRRQAAPGIKITTRAFGRERRYPITNRFSA